MKMLDEIIKRVRNLKSEQQEEILEILKTLQSGKQRDYPRLDTNVDIDVVIGDRVIQTDAKDISAGGIYINTSGKFEANKNVRVVFTIPGSDKPFKLEGMIVRVEQNGIAIKFSNITPYFKKMLDDIIWTDKDSDGGFL
ncbi:PilZ domain-containing protein [Desulfobacterales bacterium HSG17]|nr:PilZ domain-containing protein [Desulfobacterales bacterium HSG17]